MTAGETGRDRDEKRCGQRARSPGPLAPAPRHRRNGPGRHEGPLDPPAPRRPMPARAAQHRLGLVRSALGDQGPASLRREGAKAGAFTGHDLTHAPPAHGQHQRRDQVGRPARLGRGSRLVELEREVFERESARAVVKSVQLVRKSGMNGSPACCCSATVVAMAASISPGGRKNRASTRLGRSGTARSA